jgi:two-component system cit operon sensor histidine kinase CitA
VLDYQATELFLNLLDNAARAVLERWGPGSKGHVWLTLDLQDSSHARVRVADNGVGIAPDIRDRIFEYGFSGRPDRSQSYGVGLWWCSLYVQRHGGSLTIGDSDASGGAAFDVVLPLSLATRTEERTD